MPDWSKTFKAAGCLRTEDAPRVPETRHGRGSSSRLSHARRNRAVFPHGGNDRVFTPDELARDIVLHFRPCGRILEPCFGGGAFVRALPGCDWCEIEMGFDFFGCTKHYDWIVTNPPYSIFTRFLAKALSVADNVVFLCPVNSWFQRARTRIIREAGFGIVEICSVPVPPKPWPQFGLSLGAAWLKSGWLGSPQWTKLPSSLWSPNGDDKMVAPPNQMDSEGHQDHCEK